jgi:2-keto-4-pentenoate hydratase
MTEGPALSEREHRRLAELLLGRRTLPPLTALSPELTIADAERIRDLVLQRRIASGDELIGAKALGGERWLAWLTSGMLLEGGAADVSALVRPRVVPRLAFRLGGPLSGETSNGVDVLAATELIMPCLDIVECRFDGPRPRMADTVAQNGGTALLQLGDGVAPSDELDRVRLQMRVDGVASEHHSGPQHDLGDLLRAVAQLGDRLDEAGFSASAGALLVSPAIGPAIAVEPGVRVIAHASGVGTLELDTYAASDRDA